MLEWIKIRDDVTCEVYYRLYNHVLSEFVASIHQIDKMFRVQILDHAPFHAKRLKVAKLSGEHIYQQVTK